MLAASVYTDLAYMLHCWMRIWAQQVTDQIIEFLRSRCEWTRTGDEGVSACMVTPNKGLAALVSRAHQQDQDRQARKTSTLLLPCLTKTASRCLCSPCMGSRVYSVLHDGPCAGFHFSAGFPLLNYSVLKKGRPYDTMEEVIGLRGTQGHGSLREWGVAYDELPLAADGGVDWDNLPHALSRGAIWIHKPLPQMRCQRMTNAAVSSGNKLAVVWAFQAGACWMNL